MLQGYRRAYYMGIGLDGLGIGISFMYIWEREQGARQDSEKGLSYQRLCIEKRPTAFPCLLL